MPYVILSPGEVVNRPRQWNTLFGFTTQTTGGGGGPTIPTTGQIWPRGNW